jgi:uncharacterized membrane protein
MSEAMLVALAGAVALFMVTLVKAEFSPDLRAAIRTTIIVILGWSITCARYGLKTWANLAWQTRWMLALSALAVILAWLFYFRANRKQTASRLAAMDCVNVGLAILFAVLFLLQQATAQSVLIGFALVGGALFFVLGSR